MHSGGIGVGGASVMLVFVVLCLTIFAVISFETARADEALTDHWRRSVQEYYEADAAAERILAEMLGVEKIPSTVLGVDIETETVSGARMVSFSCPVSERKVLYVRALISDGSFEPLEWRVRDSGTWEPAGGLPVWQG